MALIGNCTHTTYSDHKTETEVVTWVDSDETVHTETVPLKVANTQSYEGIYLVITQVDNFNNWAVGYSNKALIAYYKVYANQEARDLDNSDFLFEESIGLDNLDLDQPLYSQIYTQIKQVEGLGNLIDG
jgi:hypothetical protein